MRSWSPHFRSTFFISAFLALSGFSWWYGSVSLILKQVEKGMIGIATLEGIDVGKRVTIFYQSALVIIFLLVLSSAILWIVSKRSRNVAFLQHANHIAFWGLTGFVFYAYGVSFGFIQKLILVNIFLLIILQVFQKIHNSWTLTANFTLTLSLFSFLTSLAFSLIFVESGIYHHLNYFLLFYIISFLLFAILLIKNDELFAIRLTSILKPLAFIPLLPFLGDETYLVLNQRGIHILSPGGFFLIFLAIIVFLIFVRYFSKKEYIRIRSINKMTGIYYFPVIVGSLSLMILYSPFQEQSRDLFELANPANSVLRLVKFHEIPLLQAFSSHLFSEQVFPFVYTLLNGFNGTTDILLYNFMIIAIGAVVVYYFLLLIFDNKFLALAMVLLYPLFSVIFPSGFIFTLISLILLIRLYHYYSFRRLLIIFLYSTFLLTWKTDPGISNIVATGIFLIIFLIQHFNKRKLTDYLKAALITFLSIAILIIPLIIYRKIQIIPWAYQILDYLGANQAHGRAIIADPVNHSTSYYYFIFPVFILLGNLYLMSQITYYKAIWEKGLLAAFFLTLVYFVNAQRGIVRHGLIAGGEGFISVFAFLILALILTILLENRYRNMIFIALLSLFLIAFRIGISDEYQAIGNKLENYLFNKVDVSKSNSIIPRTLHSEEFRYHEVEAIRQFLDHNLSPDATFLDFSNSPMLYFYTQRRVPSLFNQSLQNIVTDRQQLMNILEISRLNIPVVVYSNVPENFFDATDGIPNALRYYRIGYYIHKNYRPFRQFNQHILWLKNNFIPVDTSLRSDPSVVPHHENWDLKALPGLLAGSSFLNNVAGKEIYVDFGDSYVQLNPSDVNKGFDELWLEIENRSALKKEIALSYCHGIQELGRFSFDVKPGKGVYLVPVSCQYWWIAGMPESISMEGINENIQIKKLHFISREY